MENPAHTSDAQAEKPTALTLTPAQLRGLMRAGFDTLAIARLLKATEADVYNKLAGET